MAASVPPVGVTGRPGRPGRSDHAADGVATALLAGPWTRSAILSRGRAALGRPKPPAWLGRLVDQVLAVHPEAPADRPLEFALEIQSLPAWGEALRHRRPPRIVSWTPVPTRIVSRRWPVAELHDLADLAALLDLDQGELAWFADVRDITRHRHDALRHYRWRALPRPHGQVRLVAAPKPRLKEIQRRLLRHVLAPIAVHDAAHGGVPGRSVRTALAPHAGSAVVIRADLRNFFASIPAGRIHTLLRVAGLPEPVAYTITGLTTTVVPTAVLREHVARVDPPALARLRTPHLPIGAPTSPALANLLAFTLDRRLGGLAERFGARYTRYVDDLTFSGGAALRRGRARFVELLDTVVRDEGFALRESKTVVLGHSGRQAALGAVINDRPTLPREERDALRALVHNCARDGWRAQARGRADFADHLRGRIAWASGLDPVLGARLQRDAARIDWA